MKEIFYCLWINFCVCIILTPHDLFWMTYKQFINLGSLDDIKDDRKEFLLKMYLFHFLHLLFLIHLVFATKIL